jgi:hypothetical protein
MTTIRASVFFFTCLALAFASACARDKALLCPQGTEYRDGVCYRETLVGCPELECPSGSECLDNGVCYEVVPIDDDLCSAQVGGPMFTPMLEDPATEVELLHFKALRLPGMNACAPTISQFTYEFVSEHLDGGFIPEIKMTINGQSDNLAMAGGGIVTGNWYYRSFTWNGMIHPVTNIGGDSIQIWCTNCTNDQVPPDLTILTKLTGWWWNNNPGEPIVFEYFDDFEHFTIFTSS